MTKQIMRIFVPMLAVSLFLLGTPACKPKQEPKKEREQPKTKEPKQPDLALIGSKWQLKNVLETETDIHVYHFLERNKVRYLYTTTSSDGGTVTKVDKEYFYYYKENQKTYFMEQLDDGGVIMIQFTMDWDKMILYWNDNSGEAPIPFEMIQAPEPQA